ncbi:hypothetical protein BB561_006808 [Smittium simulii]|uniref:Uncharacterized protein n=1 Tax=Smittium simulii TaxID=133385 RepID=A0A2T9Y1E3_9FUNG|nr:hypothetical protein BB561_006808 [Smittium simulii]
MYGEYKEIMLQTKSTGVQDQDVEVQYNNISINYSSGNYDKLTNYDNSELRILETESLQMERSIVSTRDSKNGNLYRCQQHSMGNSCWIPVLFRNVASINSISTHKRLKIISSVLRAINPQRFWLICLSISDNTITLAYVRKFEEATSPILLESRRNGGITGEDNNDNNNSNVEVGNSRLCQTQKAANILYSKTNLGCDGMKNQRRALQQEGLTYLVLNQITANNRSVKRRSRYYSTQRYLWTDYRHTSKESRSDIHRVDDERTDISNNSIKLIICAPKEKRKSSPIKRLVEIKAHSNEILCPVIAYRIYKQIIANIPCPKPHHIQKNQKKSITIIAVKDKKRIAPKAREIEVTIGAKTGISTDAILTQANWTSYYMLSSYYKPSNNSYSNITGSVLSKLT